MSIVSIKHLIVGSGIGSASRVLGVNVCRESLARDVTKLKTAKRCQLRPEISSCAEALSGLDF